MAADPAPVRRLKVFLCHAREDKPTVRLLHKRLTGDGYQPWLDEEDILGGQDWRHAIKDAVQSSDILLVCLSTHSILKEGYVQAEIRQGLELAREKPDETFFVIPARLEECPVPKLLEDKQWIDLHAANGYDKLRRSLDARSDHLQLPRRHAGEVEIVRPPSVTVTAAMSWLGLILERNAPQKGTINLDCLFKNPEHHPVSIYHLEAWVTDPYNAAIHLGWHIFYKTEGGRQLKTGEAAIVTLGPGETRKTGVQFTAPPSIAQYRWSPGLHTLDLVGWLAPPRPGDRPAMIAPYEMRVDPDHAQRVATWRTSYVHDSDNAISIPVPIVPAKTP